MVKGKFCCHLLKIHIFTMYVLKSIGHQKLPTVLVGLYIFLHRSHFAILNLAVLHFKMPFSW